MSSNAGVMNSAPNSGFLSGFVESSMEMPSDGLNGNCTVHYGGEHSEYELNVTFVNGVRERRSYYRMVSQLEYVNIEMEYPLETWTNWSV